MLRWLKRRGAAQGLIVAVFALPILALSIPKKYDSVQYHGFYISPYSYSGFLPWVRNAFASLELGSIDYRIRFGTRAPVSPEIVFLTIDQASTPAYLQSLYDPQTIASSRPLSLMAARFPYPRDVYALVFDRLIAAGARVVALDVLFPGPSVSDAPLRDALARDRDQVVIGSNFGYDPLNGRTASLSLPSASLFPEQDPFDHLIGYVNYWPDDDDLIRDVQYRTTEDYVNRTRGAEAMQDAPKLFSFAARVLQKGGHAEIVPDDFKARTMRFAGPPQLPFRNYSLYKIFDDRAWAIDFKNGEFFRGKIVVVGPQGSFMKDQMETPYGLMDGAEIHLNAINALLQNQFLQRPPLVVVVASILAAGAISLGLALAIAAIAWRFLAAVAVLAGYVGALIWAYNGPGWLLPAVAPMSVFCGATGVGFVYDFVLAQVERLRLRTTFERYNSKNVVKYLLDHTANYSDMQRGTRRPVTVLFSDIRGFTTMVEEATDSQRLVDQLNEYFTEMVACVFRFDGSLDKFMGDGIMAIWGNTPYNFGPKEDAVRAVRAALAMGEALPRLNAKWCAEGRREWQIGIALNHGEVIVGDIGSQQRKEFGVLGDAINLGSRLEGLTKEYHLQLLLGESVAELVRDEFILRSVDVVQVKGRAGAVKTFAVIGEKSVALDANLAKFLARHEEGMAAFRGRDFARARELWVQAWELQPDDFIVRQYLESCEALIAKPPDAAWTGVRVMKEK